jgi:ceramide glucosyltransferase
MFINEWFLPSVLVARSLREISFCFGATMAVRRDVFDAFGGFPRLAPYLADDYMLGKLVTEHGYSVHLSSYVVENMVVEQGFKAQFAHELRWARTIRTVQPLGYAFSFITYVTPLAIVAGLLDEFSVDTGIFELGYLAIAIALRIALHFVAHGALGISHGPSPWLVPVRDVLGFVIWFASFFGNNVTWKDQTFSIDRAGHLFAKE